MYVCVCVSAVSVSGIPPCGFLLLQSSPYLHFHSTGDKCVSEEINDFTMSMIIFSFFIIRWKGKMFVACANLLACVFCVYSLCNQHIMCPSA